MLFSLKIIITIFYFEFSHSSLFSIKEKLNNDIIHKNFTLLNQTRYTNDFFFEKDKAIVESQIFSFLNNIISKKRLSGIYDKLLEKFVIFFLDFFERLKPFPQSVLFDINTINCISKIYELAFQYKNNPGFYVFFEATGKDMNDFGNEHNCKHNLNEILDSELDYYLFQAHIADAKKLTNVEDYFLMKFLAQNFFYVGICAPKKCTNLMRMMLKNKEFLDFLYKYLSLSNFTLKIDEEEKRNFKNDLDCYNTIVFIFYGLITFKVVASIFKSFKMKKDYERFFLDRSKKDSLSTSQNNEVKDNELKEIYFGITYGTSTKEEVNLYNPFHDNQDKYPCWLKFLKVIDIADNLKILSSITNKYYNSCGIKRIYLLKIVVMFMSISLKLMISQIELPSKSFLVYEFYKKGWFFIVKICIFSSVFWIVLDAMTAGFKLMSFLKKNKGSLENKLGFTLFQFSFLLIPKIFLFILCYIFFHILNEKMIYTLIDQEHHLGPLMLYNDTIRNGTYSLRNDSFGHRLKCMMPIYINYIDYFYNSTEEERVIEIEGNGQLNPSNATNNTYYKYEKTRYKIPSPFLTNTDLFINIYLNEFCLLIFMLFITYLSYKIRHKSFDLSILGINILLYFIPLLNWTKWEIDEEENYSLLYILGQNFSEKYTHYFINFYYFGFLLGVMLFYQNESNYLRMSKKIEESIVINSIGRNSNNSSSYESFSSNNDNSYNNYMPFYFCKKIISALNKLSFLIKSLILFFSTISVIIISLSFYFMQKPLKDSYSNEIPMEELNEQAWITIPKFKDLGVRFIFLYEKNFCCIFFFIFLMILIVFPSDNIFMKILNLNCFALFDRISFSTFCTFNFFVYSSFCSFYLDFKIMMTNIVLNSIGIFILLLILNIFFVSIFELPLRILIKSLMNRKLVENFRNNYISGSLLGSSRRTTTFSN